MKAKWLAVLALLVAGGARGQTLTTLWQFGSGSDGYYPQAVLVQGSDGNFYGTASSGGTNGEGTVFRISPSGTYTTLCSFGSTAGDGTYPQAGLVRGSDGNFYGTTSGGGEGGAGTVFRISPSGSYTSLYSFGSIVSPGNDGRYPHAGLVQGSDGNFYGTTLEGGTYDQGGGDSLGGTVFRISPSGTYARLYSFSSSPTDGEYPQAGLVQGSDSNFYGTTENGGMNVSCNNGCGTIFRISPSGTYTSLYSFGSSFTDGENPQAGLVRGSDGNFYGTTYYGGSTHGTIFRISLSGSYASLYWFGGSPNDGAGPEGLVQGSDANFYGTTAIGGTDSTCCNEGGIVFRISPSGTETNLHSFGVSPSDGSYPQAGLVQGSDGNFYGTTYYGGTNSEGTVFRLYLPLNSPANQIGGFRLAGTNNVFAIPSVAGETYQLQFRAALTGAWANIVGASVSNSIGGMLTLTNFAGASQPQGFYRFEITP